MLIETEHTKKLENQIHVVQDTQKSDQFSFIFYKAKVVDEVEDNNRRKVAVFTTNRNPMPTF